MAGSLGHALVCRECSGHTNVSTLPNQYAQNAENVQILHTYHKITGILCLQFAGLTLNMSENIEISINFSINLSHSQFTLMGVLTIDKGHLVTNIGECIFVLIDQDKKFTYFHHCTFFCDHKFGDYRELPYCHIIKPEILQIITKCYTVHNRF